MENNKIKLDEEQYEKINFAIKYKKNNVELSNIYTNDGYNVSVVIVFKAEILREFVVEIIKTISKFNLKKFYLEDRGFVINKTINVGNKIYNILMTTLPKTYFEDDLHVQKDVFVFQDNQKFKYKIDLIRIELLA